VCKFSVRPPARRYRNVIGTRVRSRPIGSAL
jgi:hypothetical protein